MTVSTAAVRVGTMIQRDGRVWTVVELHADRVQLRSASSSVVTSIAELINDPNTGFVDSQLVPGDEIGAAVDNLTEVQRTAWLERVANVREVLTGYRSGDPVDARPGEPRSWYRPGTEMTVRYRAKAEELTVAPDTVSRWVRAYRREGAGALIDGRGTRMVGVLDSLDQRWVDMCRTVSGELSFQATHTKKYVLTTVQARMIAEYSPGVVPIPGRTTAYRALDEITKGTNMFQGSSKGRREIALRPEGVYGRLWATRLGEYVLLDTTRLDVYAMEKVTYRWVNTELTAAMDLYGRIICGLCLEPVSTRSTEVASVLYEVICPSAKDELNTLPYIGFPECLLVPTDPSPAENGGAVIPIETVVVDHGRVFMSEHIRNVLERFGVSIQPVRLYKGSDKGPLERWFRTLREGLLEHLDGYMGPDVYSRGKDAESGAFYFVDELEQIIRDWVRNVYHQRPHEGLVVPAAPGLNISPAAMYQIGIASAGFRRIPTSPDSVYDFLPVEWRKINHYGIEFHSLVYNDDVLAYFSDVSSPYKGRHAGKYPFRYDPNDISCIYFQHPDHHTWHRIKWVHADAIREPFSIDALQIARQLASRREPDRFPDDRLALIELLTKWSRTSTRDRRERKAALQQSEDYASLLRRELDSRDADEEPMGTLFERMGVQVSDDDLEIDSDEEELSEGEYYVDAMEKFE
ncbi:transposase InsO family protein [Rhodococcus sp. PvR044]|uniref:Mu transposase C-terminal domain-containing protein n=1 Tax=Rhodococcus sp. PvR044 TaxID=3156402 RepID=UPI00339966D2